MGRFSNFFSELTDRDWEFFAEDFFCHLGFLIEQRPSIGPDGGQDLIVSNPKRYIVSCKHYVKSGKAVGTNDEQNISDRIVAHDCIGFIGFYSTTISSSLAKRFNDLVQKCGYEIYYFDETKIGEVIPTMQGSVLQKYFTMPQKISDYYHESDEYPILKCECCGTNILHNKDTRSRSMVAVYSDTKEKKLFIYYGCKHCINTLRCDGWFEINQLIYKDQMHDFNQIITNYIKDGFKFDELCENSWAIIQSEISKISVPELWGRWL